MSSLSEHEARAIEVLGRPWTDVHEWLDQYFTLVPGVAHRIVLHHRLSIELGVAMFGADARAALEQHVQDDFECLPDTPEEVAAIVANQDLLSLADMDILHPVLDRLWPERFVFPWEEMAVMHIRGR